VSAKETEVETRTDFPGESGEDVRRAGESADGQDQVGAPTPFADGAEQDQEVVTDAGYVS
jgi:hypothetical protein